MKRIFNVNGKGINSGDFGISSDRWNDKANTTRSVCLMDCGH